MLSPEQPILHECDGERIPLPWLIMAWRNAHTIALHLIQSGVDITVVRDWLGHADVKTTSLYVDINTEMKRKALEACPPPIAPRTAEPATPLWHDPTVLKFLETLSRQAAQLC